ncbi:hypothetical protein FDECE_2156 [Fusarium decemcellulare]|nr:hypothetical protein FDECE_2156 [Fusarium decemcellulare]
MVICLLLRRRGAVIGSFPWQCQISVLTPGGFIDKQRDLKSCTISFPHNLHLPPPPPSLATFFCYRIHEIAIPPGPWVHATMVFLPDEIWRKLFSHFECIPFHKDRMSLDDSGDYNDYHVISNYTRRKTLTSLSLVCRQFNRVVHDLLYRTVLLDGMRRKEECDALLIRTLAAQPQFGLKTREISLRHHHLGPSDASNDLPQDALASLEMPTVFKQSLRNEGSITDNKYHIRSLPSVLLLLTPRVRMVDCKYRGGLGESLPWILGGTLAECQELTGSAAKSCANHLPHLEELRLTVGFDEGTWPILQFLSIELGGRERDFYAEEDREVDLDEFGNALRELGDNLVELDLRTEEFRFQWDIDGAIGSLRSLKSLRHLTMFRENLPWSEDEPDDGIRLAEALPPLLETLELFAPMRLGSPPADFPYNVKDEIYDLITGGDFPNLRKLVLWRWACRADPEFELGIEGWSIDKEDTWELNNATEADRIRTWLSISREN